MGPGKISLPCGRPGAVGIHIDDSTALKAAWAWCKVPEGEAYLHLAGYKSLTVYPRACKMTSGRQDIYLCRQVASGSTKPTAMNDYRNNLDVEVVTFMRL